MAKDALWMRWIRSRNESGELRQKRSDTFVWTIEKQYWVDLDVRSDMHLWTYLKNNNIESLNDLVNGK